MTHGLRHERQLFLIGAGTVVVDPQGRVLMLEQRRGDGELVWEGPGGALEADESPAECAVRETHEETGLTVRLDRLLRVSEYWEASRFIGLGLLYLARPHPWPQPVVLPATPDGETHFLAYRWCTRDEIESLDGRWVYDITRTAWPEDITTPIFDRLDFPA